MEITYRLRVKNLLRFNLYAMARARSYWITLGGVLLLVLGPQMCVWLFNGVPAAGALYLVQQLITLSIILIIVIAVVISFQIVIEFLKDPKSSVCKMRVSPDGFSSEHLSVKTDVKWINVKQVSQNRAAIMFFISDWRAYLIPREAFTEQSEAARFFAYCNEHWEKARNEIKAETKSPLRQDSPLEKPSSRLGLVSLLLCSPLLVALLIIPAADGIVGRVDDTTSLVTGLLAVLGIFFCVIGFLVGIAGLFQKNRAKTLPIMGIFLNASFLLLVGSILLIR